MSYPPSNYSSSGSSSSYINNNNVSGVYVPRTYYIYYRFKSAATDRPSWYSITFEGQGGCMAALELKRQIIKQQKLTPNIAAANFDLLLSNQQTGEGKL